MFIKSRLEQFAVTAMCRVLDIERSGFYAWLKTPQSQRARHNEWLTGQIKQHWLESGCVYGYAMLFALCCNISFAENSADTDISKPKITLELFTSQGCSSCPPADRILEKLSALPNVVALSRPVQYWDRLGWKDTLATSANTDLQFAYASRWHQASVYTPQLVIDGSEDVVGNQEATIRRRIKELYEQKSGVTIRSTPRNDGSIAVTLTGNTAAPAEVHLLWLRASTSVLIGRGENATHRIRYVNAVMTEKIIGAWSGKTQTLNIDSNELHNARSDRLAIVVQEHRQGRILGADYLNVASH